MWFPKCYTHNQIEVIYNFGKIFLDVLWDIIPNCLRRDILVDINEHSLSICGVHESCSSIRVGKKSLRN